jgi:hypothetical protein
MSRFKAEVQASRLKMQQVSALLAAIVQNHPGHDQKSHGRKGRAKTGGMSGDDFDRVIAGAASGKAAHDMARVRVEPDSSQERAIHAYGIGGYDESNRQLRTNGGDVEAMPPTYYRDVVEGMDSIIAGSTPLGGDIVVVRGVVDASVTFGGREIGPGMEWTDHAYSSTTTREHTDHTFTGDSGVEMRIFVPKGTRAVSHYELDPSEVVLDRGLRFRVVRDNGVHPHRGTRQLDVEVVGTRG